MEGGPAPRMRRTGPPGVSQSSREAGTLLQAANIHRGFSWLSVVDTSGQPTEIPALDFTLPKGEGVGVGGTLTQNNPGHSTVC